MHRDNLCNFNIERKTPDEKEILNISVSWLEMSFLSIFNIFLGILSGSTDLLESNKDMAFSLPFCQWDFR